MQGDTKLRESAGSTGVSGIWIPVKGLTHQHSPRWPWVDMLHWKEEREKHKLDKLENTGKKREG
ncbi:hypothetical protein INR49_026818 [Caranx melampygus]|nr:hypothetical protein INR49_026818 [Caranx melampygus]